MQIVRQPCKMEQLNTNLLDSRCYKRELQTRIGLEIRFCNFDAIHDLHLYGFNEFKSIEWVREKNLTPTFPFTWKIRRKRLLERITFRYYCYQFIILRMFYVYFRGDQFFIDKQWRRDAWLHIFQFHFIDKIHGNVSDSFTF